MMPRVLVDQSTTSFAIVRPPAGNVMGHLRYFPATIKPIDQQIRSKQSSAVVDITHGFYSGEISKSDITRKCYSTITWRWTVKEEGCPV